MLLHQVKAKRQYLLLVIQIIFVTIVIIWLANLTTNTRVPHLIDSTKTIISQYSRIRLIKLMVQVLRVYWFYIGLSACLLLLIICLILKQKDSKKEINENSLILILLFSISFYLLNVHFSLNGKQQYISFYQDFKNGRIGHQFKGFKLYHFLNHAEQTKKSLNSLKNKANNVQEISLVESLTDLIKRQDKSISTFRSYLANYNLICKAVHIFYYSCAFLGLLILSIGLSLHYCYLTHNKSSSNYKSIHSQESDQEIPESKSNNNCLSISLLLFIVSIFSACILANLLLGDFLLELQIGHPYDQNQKQTHLCSFHKLIGGLYINIDYQNQLDLIQEYSQLEKMFANQSQTKVITELSKLEAYLSIYMKLCESLQPYFQKTNKFNPILVNCSTAIYMPLYIFFGNIMF